MNEKYPLPEGWRWVRLGEVFKLRSGKPRPKIVKKYSDTEYKYEVYGGNGVMGFSDEYLLEQPTVVLGRVGENCGAVHITNQKVWVSDNALFIKEMLINDINLSFLALCLIMLDLNKLKKKTGQPLINQNIVYSQRIPLPLLPEQHRITTKIQELMQEIERARTACEKQLEAAKALPSSYLRQTFESEEAKKWERKKLGEVREVVTGSTPRTDDSTNWDGEILWATPNDMGKLAGFTIDDTERKISGKGLGSCSTKLLPSGSVLLTTRAPIGHLALNTKPMCTNQGFKSFIPSSQMHNWFLFFVLKYFVPVLQSMGRGQTFTEISKKQVVNFEIPFPTLPIQHHIATVLKEKMTYADKLYTSIEKQFEAINALSQAILRKAFRGEL
jgi:type I restriction enzyme S subunit